MNGHRCIHCNEVSPEHLRICAALQHGMPGEDYHTDPPDHVVPPVLDEHDEALRVRDEEIERLRTDLASVTTERDRLQRACNEGLPRERIDCPACRKRHVEGPRHDNPSIDGRTRPHHTHRCYHCGHVWPTDRWSFGVAEGEETAVAPSEIERLRTDLATLRAEFDAVQFSRSAARQDAEYLARAVGRVAYELVFENSKGTRQAATAYVLADERAYAPILGPSVPLFATIEDLGRELAVAFGDGFRLTSTEKTTR